MKTYLCDCKYTGESRYIKARNWDEAQDTCFEDDLVLIGEYEGSYPGPDWLPPTPEEIH